MLHALTGSRPEDLPLWYEKIHKLAEGPTLTGTAVARDRAEVQSELSALRPVRTCYADPGTACLACGDPGGLSVQERDPGRTFIAAPSEARIAGDLRPQSVIDSHGFPKRLLQGAGRGPHLRLPLLDTCLSEVSNGDLVGGPISSSTREC